MTRWSRCWKCVRRDVLALGLPLRSIEVREFGPSQCELAFAPKTGMEPADDKVICLAAP